VGQVLTKDSNNALQLRMSRAFILAAPSAVLLTFLCSMSHFMLGELEVTPLSAPGLLLTVVFLA